MKKLPFTQRQRRKLCCQYGYGHRERNNWNSGDLPAPYAEGDIVYCTEVNDRIARCDPKSPTAVEPGYFVVAAGFSIDEGDAWYFRVSRDGEISDRLPVIYKDRSTLDVDANWMSIFTLVETSDPAGLAEREQLLAAGWEFPAPKKCPTCGQRIYD